MSDGEELLGPEMKVPTSMVKMRHEEVLALWVSGWTTKQIAKRFGYAEVTVRKIIKDPDYQATIRGLQTIHIGQNLANSMEVLQQSATEAVLTLRELMRNAVSEQVRLSAANSILDRAGLAKRAIIEHEDKNVIDEPAARFLMSVFQEARQKPEAIEMIEDSAGVFNPVEGTGLTEEEWDEEYGGYSA